MKHKIKVASYVRLTRLAVEQTPSIKEFEKTRLIEEIKDALPKGCVFISKIKVREGYASDDFVHDMFTIVAERFAIKAPRFMYNRYLRLKKYTRNLVQ